MIAVLITQFVSAFADNALLFAAIALPRSQMAESWQIPLLQQFFVIAFIVFAPFAGPFADSLSKGRVMLLANGMKFFGSAAMLAGLHPLLAYCMVGIGAAAYSPAKYGILSELVSPDKLVKANSMIEGSTIVAFLLGVIIGGLLADYSVSGALLTITGVYLLAMAAKLVTLKTVNRASPAGILIGALIIAFAYINDLYVAVAMLILVGACGGFYVVPLNALLQDRGHATTGSGHAIAVKNFFDNLCMLLMIGAYTLMDKSGVIIITSTVLIGAIIIVAIGLITHFRLRQSRNTI